MKELLRVSQEAEKQRKLMGLDDRTLRQMAEVREELDRIGEYRTHLAIPHDLQNLVEGMRSVAREQAALALGPLMGSIADANLAALNLGAAFTYQQPAIDLAAMAGVRAYEWQKAIGGLGGIPIERYLADHFEFLSERSVLAQANLVGINLASHVPNLDVAANILTDYRSNFEGLSSSYKDLFESFAIPATNILNLPPRLTEFPTFEYFNEVELLSTTVEREDESEFTEQIVVFREEIRVETPDLVIVQLGKANPKWIKMLEGARQSLRSDNPDRIRHSITSLRELVREIMHFLSPEDDLRAWSNSADHFANNRPTRKARLQYIAREIDHGPFGEFVKKDIESMIAMINLFQAGTHAADTKLTEPQVAALLARVEGVVLFLFTIANPLND